MRAYVLKKERRTIAVSMNEAFLWREAYGRSNVVGSFVVYASDKQRLRDQGWDVVRVECVEIDKKTKGTK